MKTAILCSDLLRIDEGGKIGLNNPQLKNLKWIETLFGKHIKNSFDIDTIKSITGDEDGFYGVKGLIYSRLALPYNIESWASLYEGEVGFDIISEVLDAQFEDCSLVVGFELPPYLIKYLELREIIYIDFTIHPIRFLPDYMLGIRSNSEDIYSKLQKVTLDKEVIEGFADVSKARSARILPADKYEKDSAIFLGQTEVDSSLIKDGVMCSYEDIENSLIELSMVYPHVYYKIHPYNKNQEKIKNIVGKIKNCKWVDINVYDAFYDGLFSLVASMSSGALVEASYFGCKTKSFLGYRECFNLESDKKSIIYYPIYKDFLKKDFWSWIAGKIDNFSPAVLDPYDGAVKFSLNMKWGR